MIFCSRCHSRTRGEFVRVGGEVRYACKHCRALLTVEPPKLTLQRDRRTREPNTDGRKSTAPAGKVVPLPTDLDSLSAFEPEQPARQRHHVVPPDEPVSLPHEPAAEVIDADASVQSGILFASRTSALKAARLRALLYVTIGLMITAAAGILLRSDPPLPAAGTQEAAIPVPQRAPDAVEATTGSRFDRDSKVASASHSSAAVSIDPPVAASTPNADALSGWWSLTNRVESTSYQAFDQLNLGYRVRLEQHGNRVTGQGNKWLENGKRLPAAQQTPIVLEGTVDGDLVHLEFKEHGARRTSAGTLDLQAVGNGTLRGTFVSDAADSQGTSHARRLDSEPTDH